MLNQKPSNPEALGKALEGVYEGFLKKNAANGNVLVPIAGTKDGGPQLFKTVRAGSRHNALKYANLDNPELAYAVMKACLENQLPLDHFQGGMGKASINVASNIYGYDLQAPSIHLIPFLSPLRDITPRMQRAEPGNAYNWKTINGFSTSNYTTGGYTASPWINEGQRAPLMTLSAGTNTATYITIGIDGSDTYEAQSSAQNFEDPLATARFIGLESLMVKEEDAILGGNTSLALGQTNTPTGTATGTGSLTGVYAAVVGLSYEGYRNQSLTGLVQQLSINTPDNKTMQVNGGTANPSAISSTTGSSSASVTFSVVPKNGEMAYAWYAGSSNATSALHLVAITTVPSLTLTAVPTTGQLLNVLQAADFSVNNGTLGGGANQVKAFDGFLTQAINAYVNGGGTANAYYKNLLGAVLTASGRGSVVEIDTAMESAWNQFRISYDEIWVNAQELMNITTKCLSNSSGPLVRYEVNADGEHYDLTASGVISFYYNPFMPGGGRKVPVMIHPTIPPGTILLKANRLPPYFKKSNMSNVAEVVTRRDYYSVDWAPVTREYQFGTYSEEVLAVYAPFCLGVIQGIGNG